MKRFACRDIIPGCSHVFTGADDQSVLDQVILHAAEDHGLVKPPLALIELVVATTHTFIPARGRGHLHLVGAESAGSEDPSDGAPETPTRQEPAEPGTRDVALHLTRPAAGAVVSFAVDRFTRGGGSSAPAAADPAAGIVLAPAHDTYRHECLLYRGADDFLASTLPFIRAGRALDQPIMVAIAEPRLSALRDALGGDAERVAFADMADLGHNPARIIPAWREFAESTAGRPTRGIGEPIWAGRRDAEIVESQFHEALLNMAVDPATPLWLLCPYDVSTLDADVIAEAHRSHPVLVDSASPTESVQYRGTAHVLQMFEAGLPDPVAPTTALTFPAERHHEIAARVLSFAQTVGLPAPNSAKLAAAVDEIALAGLRSSGGEVNVRLWQDGTDLICQVDDTGVIDDPMIGRAATFGGQSRERGIRLANELCDLVQVRSTAAGTTVRVHSWL